MSNDEKLGMFGKFRAALDGLAVRARLANIAGVTFGGARDIYKALGYQREITPLEYRSRYRRNEVANRIVKASPLATWRGGCDVVEDENIETVTAFEQAVIDLEAKTHFWHKLYQVDVLSRIGRYAVLLIGGPGRMQDPLPRLKSMDDILYLTPFAEEDARIQFYEIDPAQPRFGLPVMYLIKRTNLVDPTAINQASVGRPVHWTRVIHVSEGLLDDRVFGEPVLEKVWNRLDDLEKVAGAGPEAFWRRADAGVRMSIDPTLDLDATAQADLEKQLAEYEHQQRKSLVVRGAEFEPMSAPITSIKAEVESLISLISAGTGIPQRVLMGSEQGKLAAKQDKATWDNQIIDRQNDYCGPMMVRPFIDRLIELNALPQPVNGANEYEIKWSTLQTMDDEQRAAAAQSWARLNMPNGPVVVLPNEIREHVLHLPPLDEATPDGSDPTDTWLAQKMATPGTTAGSERADPNEPGNAYTQTTRANDGTLDGQDNSQREGNPNALDPTTFGSQTSVVNMKGKAAKWQHVHAAADRFRAGSKVDGLRRLRRGKAFYEPQPARGRRSREG